MKSFAHQFTAIAAVASAAIFVPESGSAQTNFNAQNFNTNSGYERGYGIISANQPAGIRWEGNDPYDATNNTGETDVVQRAAGYTPAPLANSSLIQGGGSASSGILPGTNNVQVWKSFASYTNYQYIAFKAEWSIIGSSPSEAPYTNNDTFSFDLRNSANTASLLKLQFTPGINLLPNSYTLQSVVNGSAGAPIIDLGYGALFTTEVAMTGISGFTNYSISITRLDPTTRAVITNFANIASGTLSTGLSANDFGTVGIDWLLASGDASLPGSNYILVNNVQVVPEPSTYALLALAGITGAVVALRRRRQA
ncbi:MAG: PEP-CTERM sorting domain-containing protein [Rickettsiales bacterium]